MKKVLVSGSQGFIGSYICQELLGHGYEVVGVDNYSKYGPLTRAHDDHENFHFYEFDLCELKSDDLSAHKFDCIIALAAMIGGISYFHKHAYDLLATNERILASTFDYAIAKSIKRIIVASSSMVYEETDVYPTPEEEVLRCPPPMSTYGFQKLSSEYFCRGAYQQYGLPYTIIRPFNCVGVGEDKSIDLDAMTVGGEELLMSHVLPDLIRRAIANGPDAPVKILGHGNQVRCYTNGRDIARGFRLAMESDNAICNDFNISIANPTTVKELAAIVYDVLYDKDPLDLEYECLPAFSYDVQKRVPDVRKAFNILGFTAEISIRESVVEVVKWMTRDE